MTLDLLHAPMQDDELTVNYDNGFMYSLIGVRKLTYIVVTLLVL